MPRSYRIDPADAHVRAKNAAAARHSASGCIKQLSRLTLTDDDKRQLARLLLPFLDEQPAGDDAPARAGAQ